MALFGGERDVSFVRNINRELIGNIVTQQCSFYKFKLEETKVNIYGEAAEEKFYIGPVLLNCLIERDPQSYPEADMNINFKQNIIFKFLRDDFLSKAEDFNTGSVYGANLLPEVGDILLYNEGYYEIHNLSSNQYFLGKNPSYPNEENPINPGLDKFGYNISIIAEAHSVSSDKVGISRERLI
jgi:hypothetical protein|tara:strand:- start:391 stop:939 length:549 start_codon:yes stop_codon:yes gene_type:complete